MKHWMRFFGRTKQDPKEEERGTMAEMRKMTLGLCQNRHDIPVEGYIFPEKVDPLDLPGLANACHDSLKHCCELQLYVTGLAVALATVINYCIVNNIPLTLWHHDREANGYYSQLMATAIARHGSDDC